jgi:hypothetical protein
MLREKLSQIMELPFPKCLDEAHKKLYNTWMIVNGNPGKITGISETILEIYSLNQTHTQLESNEVKSLEIWMPQTGIYQYQGKTMLLLKNPKKQWRKSFNIDLYSGMCKNINSELEIVKFIWLGEFKENFWKTDNAAYYQDMKIGNIDKNGKLILDCDLFNEELYNLSKKDESWKTLL